MPKKPDEDELKRIINELIQKGYIIKLNNKYFLTEEGLKATNEIDIEKIECVLKANN